jgi:branched-chain amino acid transport system substrate-binding protein
MNKKVWMILIICLAIGIIGVLISKNSSKVNSSITFGATFPLTGEVASYGQKAKNGIELALDEINSTGGLLGKNVQVDFQDDKNDKKEAVNIVNKFISIDKYPVIFGSAGSGVSLAICPITQKNKIVQISPISSSALLSAGGGDYFFRTVPADDQQAEILSKEVIGSGIKRVALVYTNNSWGKPLSEGFKEKFVASGGEVLIEEGVQENTNDFRTILSKIKQIEGLEAIVSPTYPKEGGVLVRQIKELGLSLKLFGGDNWGSPEFRDIAGNSAEGVMYTAPAQRSSATYDEFAKKYEGKYGEAPDVFVAYSHDAFMAIVKAVQQRNSIESEQIRQGLLGLDFEGVSGQIKFKANGDLDSEAYAVMTIKNGNAVPIN